VLELRRTVVGELEIRNKARDEQSKAKHSS